MRYTALHLLTCKGRGGSSRQAGAASSFFPESGSAFDAAKKRVVGKIAVDLTILEQKLFTHSPTLSRIDAETRVISRRYGIGKWSLELARLCLLSSYWLITSTPLVLP